MSPRSDEFMAAARRQLRAARVLLDDGIPENAAGEAYFAMFNAARAALSEAGEHAKTHRGVWSRFSERFVRPGDVDQRHQRAASKARQQREGSDYAASGATTEEATATLAAAEEFVAAIEALFAEDASEEDAPELEA